MTNFLYIYTLSYDPLFEEFTYGEAGKRAEMLRNQLHEGDYLFFWTNLLGRLYITAYYVVDFLMEGNEARRRRDIKSTYKSEHLQRSGNYDDVIVFGNPKKSLRLGVPLPLTRDLLKKLSIAIPYDPNRSETFNINSALRNVMGKNCKLSDAQVKTLLDEIDKLQFSGEFPLEDWDERAVELVLARNPSLLEKDLKLVSYRQLKTPHGVIDLLFQDKDNAYLVVEVKKGTAPDDTLTQLLNYISYVKKTSPKNTVRGAIICSSCSRRLEEAAKESGVKILSYQGMLTVKNIV